MFANPFHDENEQSDTSEEEMLGNMTQQSVEIRNTEDAYLMSHKGFHNPFGLEAKQENDIKMHNQNDHPKSPSMHNIAPENVPRPSVKDLIKAYEFKKVEQVEDRVPDVPAEGRGSVKDLINKFEKRNFSENKNVQSGNGNIIENKGAVGSVVQEIEKRIAENEQKRTELEGWQLLTDNKNQDVLSEGPRRTAGFGGSGSSSLQNFGSSDNDLDHKTPIDKSMTQEFLADITEDDESLNLSAYKPMMNNPLGLNQSYLAGKSNRSELDLSRSKINYSNISQMDQPSQFTDYRIPSGTATQLQFNVDPQANFDQQNMDLRVNQYDDHVLSQVTEDTQDLSHLTMMQFHNNLYQKDNSLYLNMTALNQSNVSGMNRSHIRDKSQEFNKSMNQRTRSGQDHQPSDVILQQDIQFKHENILGELNIAQQVLEGKPKINEPKNEIVFSAVEYGSRHEFEPRPTASFGNFGALAYPQKNPYDDKPIYETNNHFQTNYEAKPGLDVYNYSSSPKKDIIYRKENSFGEEKPLSHYSASPVAEAKYEELGKISSPNPNPYTTTSPLYSNIDTASLYASIKSSEVMKPSYEIMNIKTTEQGHRESPVERYSPTNFYTDVKITESFHHSGSPKLATSLERVNSGPASPAKPNENQWQLKTEEVPTLYTILSRIPSHEEQKKTYSDYAIEAKIPTLTDQKIFTSIHSDIGSKENKPYEIPLTSAGLSSSIAIQGLYSSNLFSTDYKALSPSKVSPTPHFDYKTNYDFHEHKTQALNPISVSTTDYKYNSSAPYTSTKDIKSTDLYTESWKTHDIYGKPGVTSTYEYKSTPLTTTTGYTSNIVAKQENSPGLYSLKEKPESPLKSYSPTQPVHIASTYTPIQDNLYTASYKANVEVNKAEIKVPLKFRRKKRSRPQILNPKGTLAIPVGTDFNFVIPTDPKEYAAVKTPYCKGSSKNTRKKFFGLKVRKEKFMRAINERKLEKEGLEIVCPKCLGQFTIDKIDSHSLGCYSYIAKKGEADELKVWEDIEELNRKLQETKRKVEEKLRIEQNVGWQFSDIAMQVDKVIRENQSTYLIQDTILDINRKIDEITSGDPTKNRPMLLSLVKRILLISKQKLSKLELTSSSEADLTSLTQKTQIYQKEILAVKPPIAVYQYQVDMIHKINLGASSKHIKASYYYEPKLLLDIESDIDFSENEEKNQVVTSSVRSKIPLKFDAGPAYKKSHDNGGNGKKVQMYSMAVSYKLGLPPGHPGKNFLVGDLYNEFMSKNLPEGEWAMFLRSKYTV